MLGITALTVSLLGAVAATAAGCDPEPPQPNNDACKLPAINSAYLSVGFGYEGDCVPSTGMLQGFMMFVDFSDAEPAQDETPQSLYDFLVPKTVEWYDEATYGALSLNVTADLSAFYRMPASAASYGWERGLSWAEHQEYIQDALDAYTAKGTRPPPPESDVLYIVPVRSAGKGGISRSITFATRANTRRRDYVAKRAVTVATDVYTSWGSKGFMALAHETGHTMCLADLYPFAPGLDLGHFVGGWSAMGDVSGVGPDFFAWDKWRLGWLPDGAVDCIVEKGTTEHVLTALEASGSGSGTKAVVLAMNQTSALVAEVRVANGLDSGVCAPGVLLYTVDTSIETGQGPIRVIDVNHGSRGCGDTPYDKNDGTLSLLPGGISSYKVPGWGAEVTVIDVAGTNYTIQVEYAVV